MKYSTNQNKWLLRHKLLISMVVLLLAIIILGWVGTDYLGERARREIIKDNESAISLLSTNLTGELKIIEGAVKAMSGSPPVISLLINQSNRNLLAANAALDRYNSALNGSIAYVMDTAGKSIASSNRSDPDSFVGKSYRFRPYFVQAIQGNPGRYFGQGVTSSRRGFYASHPVHDSNNKIIGVVAMKKDLEDMETKLKSYSHCFFVNKNGVIFLSSDQNHLFKSLWPIDLKSKQSLVASKQFGDRPFDALLSQEVVDGDSITFEGDRYLVSRKFIDQKGWSIVLVTPVNRIMMYRAAGIIATFLLCTIIMIPLIVSYKTASSAEKVRESEERFKQVTLSSRGWIWELDRENRYTYSSQAVKDILDYEAEEIVGRYYYDFYLPEDKELLLQTFGMFLNGNEPFFRLVTTAARRNGEKILLESTGYPTLDRDGNVISFRGVSRDITKRRRAEDKLADALKDMEGQREKFRTLVDNAPFGMSSSGKRAISFS